MLFDLRGRGRRRTIQVIYVTLAVLMGGGLVLFGIGGNTNGGLFDALGLTDGGSNTSTDDVFKDRREAAQRAVKLAPTAPAGWAELTRVQYQDATQGDGYDQNNQVFTAKGKTKLRLVERSWDRYLALEPPKVDVGLARVMIQAFGPSALGKLDKATDAAELITVAEPTSQAFTQFAISAYTAGQTRKGDLASTVAVDKAEKADKAALKSQLEGIKSQAAQANAQAATQAATGTS